MLNQNLVDLFGFSREIPGIHIPFNTSSRPKPRTSPTNSASCFNSSTTSSAHPALAAKCKGELPSPGLNEAYIPIPWVVPPPSNSGKWRFRLVSPTKHITNPGGDDCILGRGTTQPIPWLLVKHPPTLGVSSFFRQAKYLSSYGGWKTHLKKIGCKIRHIWHHPMALCLHFAKIGEKRYIHSAAPHLHPHHPHHPLSYSFG